MQTLEQLRDAPCFGKGVFYEKHSQLLENTLKMKHMDHNEMNVDETNVECAIKYNNDYQPSFTIPTGDENNYATNVRLSMPRKYWKKLKMIRYVEGNYVISQFWVNRYEDIEIFNNLLDNKIPSSVHNDDSTLFGLWSSNENEVLTKSVPLGILKVMKYLPLNNRHKAIELEFMNNFEFERENVKLLFDRISSLNEELCPCDFYILGFEKISVPELKKNFELKVKFNFPTFYLLFENNISKKNMSITLDNELILQPSLLNEEAKKMGNYYLVSLSSEEDFGKFKGLNFAEVKKNIVISSNTKHANNLMMLAINARRMRFNGYGLDFIDRP